jgi:hypothetical protein
MMNLSFGDFDKVCSIEWCTCISSTCSLWIVAMSRQTRVLTIDSSISSPSAEQLGVQEPYNSTKKVIQQ